MTGKRSGVLVIATTNSGKLKEFEEILDAPGYSLSSLTDFPGIIFPPEGQDYAENARQKARTAAQQTGLLAVADDSGLEVHALGGRPGPFSARYGGPGLSEGERAAHLLSEVEDLGSVSRSARFICVAALAIPDGPSFLETGVCEGFLLREPSGSQGFGYDPVFALAGQRRSLAEFSNEEKNKVSHRGKALRAISRRLQEDGFVSLA